MPQVFGTFQRFEYGSLSVTLNVADYLYKVGVGDTTLEQMGYDRVPIKDYERDMFYGYTNASHLEGSPYNPPYEFSWSFQILPAETLRKLLAIVKLARKAGQPIKLYDGLLVLDEVAPRTRARVTTYEETIDGISYFFPIFQVWPKIESLGRKNNKGWLKMTAKEWSPDQPVTGDVAA
jgi:hypothetical protein